MHQNARGLFATAQTGLSAHAKKRVSPCATNLLLSGSSLRGASARLEPA